MPVRCTPLTMPTCVRNDWCVTLAHSVQRGLLQEHFAVWKCFRHVSRIRAKQHAFATAEEDRQEPRAAMLSQCETFSSDSKPGSRHTSESPKNPARDPLSPASLSLCQAPSLHVPAAAAAAARAVPARHRLSRRLLQAAGPMSPPRLEKKGSARSTSCHSEQGMTDSVPSDAGARNDQQKAKPAADALGTLSQRLAQKKERVRSSLAARRGRNQSQSLSAPSSRLFIVRAASPQRQAVPGLFYPRPAAPAAGASPLSQQPRVPLRNPPEPIAPPPMLLAEYHRAVY
ncbi:hypothetical protein DIPPA_33861 [Diplonema papillatum]|nr:hypothetical protein DIPPA_33861 [Diplonema papillatum]